MHIEESVLLAPYTTFQIGGRARYFARVRDQQELQGSLAFAGQHALAVAVLGGGSNVLIADDGFDGLVIKLEIKGITQEVANDGTFVITAGAGESWDALVGQTLEHNLFGLVNLSGIPGSVGGAVVANAGAYGAQVSDTFVSAEVWDREKNSITVFHKDECRFSYHSSIFGQERDRYLVLSATFALPQLEAAHLAYKDYRFDLEGLRSKLGHEPSPLEVREAVLDTRNKKGYLIMEGYDSFKSPGSFFHMPYVSRTQYEHVVEVAEGQHKDLEERLRPWAWEQRNGTYKLAPGFLLEFTKFKKGYIRGEVGISPRHILSIINLGKATAREVAELADDMNEEVYSLFGVRLEREVEYIGNI